MKKITLSSMSELAQIVSAIAVVLSLVYVGQQIKANTEATRSATRQSIAETDFEFISTILDPLTLLEAETKLLAGLDLSPSEHLALVERQHLNFRVFENAYYQFSTGLLEPETWERFRRIIRFLLTEREPAQTMWVQKKHFFDESFKTEIKSILNR
ncbi:MAG: hypothetical protein GY863_21950 [bacterium]|nr:hypothetical protein [bacterium]